ncbi:hypothetical protein [Prescottella agglutinans]|uniref:Extradiol ring-cleavage dioxygenase LigAB LigA subunit domain-containing protein n=1 Tax=Prescottella agglutinans TaxID=1644129 RepID=A0ABT6M962_9NOCA|nr:hypothetical protein [Prescottella agglutinans]MDH6280780.1 hypothetical protein [Prescottella agglutinans]
MSVPIPFEFRGQGYRHYKYPEPDSYDFNRLLQDFRDPDLRARYLDDPESVAGEYNLGVDERDALATLDVDTCVAAGAHPLLAWTGCRMTARDRDARSSTLPGTP